MLPLATTTWDEKEYQALQKVIDSGMFSMGKYVAEFEKQFAEFVGANYCVMVNSGSSANLLGIAALRYHSKTALQPGDEVIVPAVSWSTTYAPLHQYGLKLVFVDVDDTLNLDIEQVKAAITDKTRAIFAVNLLGNPVDYVALTEVIEGKDILLMEDNCESLGATLNGKQAGTFGIFGSYSSFFSHHISTMEGGMVVTDDEELYHLMLSIRSHGWTRHLPEQNTLCTKSENAFEESFRFVLPGYNLRPLDMSGALGLEQLQKLPSIVQGRRANAEEFVRIFSEVDGLSIQRETGESSWFGFAMILDNGGKAERQRVLDKLAELKVDCRPIVTGNFARQEVIEHFDYRIQGELVNADKLNDSGFFIGNHHYPVTAELKEIANAIKATL